MTLLEYFDRVSVIHLPDRVDRFRALKRELRCLGIDLHDPKVQVPHAPKPGDANGFPSKGVYGNFLSHYEILKGALHDGLRTVWVLEDDAIFSRRMLRQQEQIVEFLSQTPWDLCYFGHGLKCELVNMAEGLVRYSGPFRHAHCYAASSQVLARLVSYLEETMDNPPGHPRGGRMYVDGAFSLFRRWNPDVVSLVANPLMCRQKGCRSSLGAVRWYDQYRLTATLATTARWVRDECWKRLGWPA